MLIIDKIHSLLYNKNYTNLQFSRLFFSWDDYVYFISLKSMQTMQYFLIKLKFKSNKKNYKKGFCPLTKHFLLIITGPCNLCLLGKFYNKYENDLPGSLKKGIYFKSTCRTYLLSCGYI